MNVKRVFAAAALSLALVCALALVPGGVRGGDPAGAGDLPDASAPAAPAADGAVGEGAADAGDGEAPAPGTAAPGDDPAAYEPGYALAMIADGATADGVAEAVASIPELAGATVAGTSGNMVKFALPEGMAVEDAAPLIEDAAGVAAAQPNFRYYTQGEPQVTGAESLVASSLGTAAGLSTQSAANDPRTSSQWALASLKAPAAWNTAVKLGASSKAVGVAVLDSGFLTTHEDLKNVIAKTYNAVYGTANVATGRSGNLAHGTHVAGIIAAQANNGKGVAGVAYNASGFATCKLVPVQVADRSGYIYSDTLIKACNWLKKNASAYNVRVVNMSLGNDPGASKDRYDTLLGYAVNSLWNDGIVTVAAAGNSSGSYVNKAYACWPSDLPNVVSVINLGRSSNADGVARASSSNFNTKSQKAKDISAPGTSILSTYSNSTDSYKYLTGTSMAAPAVAGVLALEFKANPKLTAPEAASKLFSSAKDLTRSSGASTGWDRTTGYGEANAAAATAAATPYLSGATTVTKGKKSQLNVKVNNAKQPAKAWNWSSSSTSVATVSATGLVTAKAAGDVVITAKKGGKVARQTLTVTAGKTHVSSLAITVAGQTYTGSARKPAPVVRDGSVTLVRGKHYKVSYSNNTNVGVATVKVTGISPYTGTTTKTFTIKPKGTSIAKLTGAAKGLVARWSKQAKQTTGYQVQVATNSAFTANKATVKKPGATATAATVSSLKANTHHYVRIRTYKTTAGKTYYSAWSPAKTVKTK